MKGLFICLLSVISFSLHAQTSVKAERVKPNPTQGEPVYTIAEQMPEYPGGNDSLMKFISRNIHYPAEAKKKKIEGKVIVRFTVTDQGKVKDIEVLKGIGSGCDEEAVRVLKMMADWSPGKIKGKAVSVYYTIPIKFKLN